MQAVLFEPQRQRIRQTSFDQRLVGKWAIGPTIVRITTDGWYYIQSSSPFSISADGQTLLNPSQGTITEYTRVFGSGTSIVGVWKYVEQDGSDIWEEEVHYRANGTYTYQWFFNGTFESEGLGFYTTNAGTLETEELRAIIATAAPDTITFDPQYGLTESGTYSVNTAGDQWTYNGPNGSFTFVQSS